MTAKPYNVQPGFSQYLILTKALISQGRVAEALDCMLELEPVYGALLAELEDAFRKHAQSAALGVDVAKSEQAWRRARARKHAALYTLQEMCRKLLNVACKGKSGVHTAVRGVPQFIQTFRDVLPANVKYKILTGTVELHHAPPVRRLRWITVNFTRLPIGSGDARLGVKFRGRPKKVEERRLGPAEHVSLHGFLTQKLSWVHLQREFR
ncbi:hypothetical protein VTK56DRAFT_7900 [Thermocarpiscus australiensis]